MIKKGNLGYEIPLLAFITAITYFMAYLYQSGYAKFYGYSPAFLGFDISVILESFIPLTYTALMVFSGVIFVRKIHSKKYGNVIFISLYFMISAPVYLLLINGGRFSFIYSPDVYLMAFFILLSMIVAMYIPTTVEMVLQNNNKISLANILSNSAMIVFISYPIGTISAASQYEFYQVKGEEYYLLSNVSGGYVLGACHLKQSIYKTEKQDSSVEFVRVISLSKKLEVKNCFHDSVRFEPDAKLPILPNITLKEY